jgi:hypothetical protein
MASPDTAEVRGTASGAVSAGSSSYTGPSRTPRSGVSAPSVQSPPNLLDPDILRGEVNLTRPFHALPGQLARPRDPIGRLPDDSVILNRRLSDWLEL